MQEVFAFLLVFTVILYIAYPMLIKSSPAKGHRKTRNTYSQNGHLSQLQSQKEQIYDSLKDLEMDYQTGKISQADYEEMKANYKTEAIAILKNIDTEQGISPKEKTTQKSHHASNKKQNNIFCPECGTKNSRTHTFCLSCGYELSNLY